MALAVLNTKEKERIEVHSQTVQEGYRISASSVSTNRNPYLNIQQLD